MPVFFNGRLYVSPATASMVDDSAMYNRNLSVGNVLALVGKSGGGKPATALRFGSAAQAIAALRPDDILKKAIEKAFDPSAETAGPSELVFVRVNPATQSALTLLDGSADPSIGLVSEDYGLYTTGLRIKVESGSVSGKKVSTGFGDDYFTEDNIERNAFSLQYSGAEATATIDVTESAVTLTIGATQNIIDLAVYDTISNLVDRINNIADVSASVLDGNGEMPALKGLDGVSAQDIKTSAYTVHGDLQAIIDWINSASEGYMTATRPAGALNVPVNIGWTYLAGGSDGNTTNSEWQDAFDALQTVDVQWVVAISPEASIHAMVDTHCSYMSNVGNKERRSFAGGATGLSDDDAIAAAKALQSDRTSYVHLGIYDYNAADVLTLYPPYVLAALIAGAFAGVNPGTSMTNKTIKVRGLERKLRNPTDTDQLLLGGVLCIEDTDSGYKVVQSITTWLTNKKYNRREVSVGAAVDFTLRNGRNALDGIRGQKATPSLLTDAVSRIQTAMNELARPEPMGPGVLVGDANNPPYKNITASIEGDVVRVELEVSPVIPANYVLLVLHAVPWGGSASA